MTNDRFYKTGDLARWLPAGPPEGGASGGVIEFLGRMDHQVKIRGFRVELGEIENLLLKHTQVKDAVAVIKEDNSIDKNIIAYVVSESEDLLDSELREYLLKDLPGYMIPAYFVRLDKIPLTPSGKVDRKALPEPELKIGEGYSAPRNNLEKKLLEIWTEILGIDAGKQPPGIDDNFFRRGGHSLKAAALMSKIHKELNVKIGLMEIFKTPTIRGIASIINGLKRETFLAVDPIEKKEYYPLSSAQKRLYFLQQLDLQSTGYNMPLALPLGRNINKEKLELTLQRLIARHESLRTSFIRINDEVVQRVHDQVVFAVETLATDAYGVHGQTQTFIRPFDLAQAPLMRSGLMTMPDGNFTWVVDVHHIISDGTSHAILSEDFTAIYNDQELKPLTLQYKDFAAWQQQHLEGEEIKNQMAYWLDIFTGEIPHLNLPRDYSRPSVFTFAGDSYGFTLTGAETKKFKQLGISEGGTLYMNFLAALNILLYKYSGQEDIIVGSAIAGRRHADLQGIVGMFINSLAMRNYPMGDKTYQYFLQEVISASVKSFENQDVQFEDLVDKLSLERDASRNPVYDVMLTVQNFYDKGNSITLGTETMQSFAYNNLTAKFDLTFVVNEQGDDIFIDIQYYRAIFKPGTIHRLAGHLKNIISAAAIDSLINIKDIEIISPEEKKQVLEEFNDTFTDYPHDKTIQQLFAEQAAQTPDYIALHGCMIGWMHGCMIAWLDGEVGANRHPRTNTDNNNVETLRATSLQVTYFELNRQADRLAGLLIEKGAGPDYIVGIMMERSIELIIGILGILKSGSAYLPIDPGYPQERID
ncbi:MAG: condensation domain-containing protein, partial [Acidobacteria bacterium]|nr:condensation domain-containing protein [Acidobacteriota bacterium]